MLHCMRRPLRAVLGSSHLLRPSSRPVACRLVRTASVQPPPAPPAKPPIPPTPPHNKQTKRPPTHHTDGDEEAAVVTAWPARKELHRGRYTAPQDHISSAAPQPRRRGTAPQGESRGGPIRHVAPLAPRPPSAPQWPSTTTRARKAAATRPETSATVTHESRNASIAPAGHVRANHLHPSLATMVDDVVCAARHTFPFRPSPARLAEQRSRLELHLWPDTTVLDATTDTIDLVTTAEVTTCGDGVSAAVGRDSAVRASVAEADDVVDVRGRRDGLRPLPAELEESLARHEIPGLLGGPNSAPSNAQNTSHSAVVVPTPQEAQSSVGAASPRQPLPPLPSASQTAPTAPVMEASRCATSNATIATEVKGACLLGETHPTSSPLPDAAAKVVEGRGSDYGSEVSDRHRDVAEKMTVESTAHPSAASPPAQPTSPWQTLRDTLRGMLRRHWR